MIKFTPAKLAEMSALFNGPEFDTMNLEGELWREAHMLGLIDEAAEGFTVAEWQIIREVAKCPRDPRIAAMLAARD